MFDDALVNFRAQLKPKDLEGLMGEAQVYFMLVSQHFVEMDSAPDRVRELSYKIADTDLLAAPLGEVIDQFIEWTQDKVYSQGSDDDDRVSVALYLALFVKSYLEVAEDAFMSFEVLFKKCYFEYYNRLGYDPDGPIHHPDRMEYLQKMHELSDELMPSHKREHIQHLRDEEVSLVDKIKQMKVICDVPPTTDPLAKYLKENLPPEMAADEKVIKTIDDAQESGLLGVVSHFADKMEAAYRATLPADEREKVVKRIDELVYTAARYNVPVFVSDYLKVVFWLHNVSPEFNYLISLEDEQDHWDGFLNDMLRYVDSKRVKGPMGDSWVREARDMVVQYRSIEEAQRMMPSIKYFFGLGDSCGKLKEVQYTDEFFNDVVDAYLKNASEYDVENAYDERCILPRVLKERVEARGEKFRPKGEYFSPVLVYDGRTHTIREDKTFLSAKGVTVVRGIGSVSDYISCILASFPVDMLMTGTRFRNIRADVRVYDDEEAEVPMTPEVLLELERSVSRHCGVSLDDERFAAVRIELARRWIEFKVNLDLCEKVPRRPEDKRPLHHL